jgi:potassium/hydrogen antiporter
VLGAPEADRIFHVVFFIMVANALVPGAMVAWVTRRLGLQKAEAPAPQAVLAIESRLPLEGELLSFHVDEALVVTGASLRDLEFPEGSNVTLIVWGEPADPAGGIDGAEAGDHVYVPAQPEDKGLI